MDDPSQLVLNTTVEVYNTTYNDSANATFTGESTITTALPQLASVLSPLIANGYLQNTLNFFLFGTVLETGRRIWQWIMDRFTAGFVLTAIFDSSDPAYEWFFAYLNEEKIWSDTREFRVTARTTSRSWGVSSSSEGEEGHAEYTPSYDQVQLFRFKGTWCQVKRTKTDSSMNMGHEDGGQLVLTLYSRKRKILDDLVETARLKYLKTSKPKLVVHGTDHCGQWCQTSQKARRPIDSLILPTGVKEMLLNDAKEFLRSEQWYAEAGIQHKRGYLLYGPPGTGKSSTVHALAGELDLEIYNVSLAANGLDDAGLSRLVGSTPAHSIILIEDIDCAFPSREELEKQKKAKDAGVVLAETKSTITLSGLLNVIDGVSSEEGRLLFATTNYVNRLDPALLRAGRMDVKLHYKMSTRDQIISLYKRFYPCLTAPEPSPDSATSEKEESDPEKIKDVKKARRISPLQLTPPPTPLLHGTDTPKMEIDRSPIYPPRLPAEKINELAERFADALPQNKYSVAELQGYLLTKKTQPFEAVDGVGEWMQQIEEEKIRTEEGEKKKAEEDEKAKKDEEAKEKEKEKEKEKTPSTPAVEDSGRRDEKEVMTEATT